MRTLDTTEGHSMTVLDAETPWEMQLYIDHNPNTPDSESKSWLIADAHGEYLGKAQREDVAMLWKMALEIANAAARVLDSTKPFLGVPTAPFTRVSADLYACNDLDTLLRKAGVR